MLKATAAANPMITQAKASARRAPTVLRKFITISRDSNSSGAVMGSGISLLIVRRAHFLSRAAPVARSGVADAQNLLDCLKQVLGLKRLGEHEMRSRLLGRGKVVVGRDRRGLIARDAEVAAPGYRHDADH